MDYLSRLGKIYDAMDESGVAVVMFEDCEARRDSTIRWLTGHPSDALLFLSSERRSVLVPWDTIMAGAHARADKIVPYNDYDRSSAKAAAAVIGMLAPASTIEVPPATPHPLFMDYCDAIRGFDLVCRKRSVAEKALGLRAVKDASEIAVLRRAADVTGGMIDTIETGVRSGEIKTEADAALLIERECRRLGCEGTGFGTLAAGPGRSFGIHAFPPWTFGPFAAKGLSILDFGLRFEGYTTDVTVTFVRDPSPAQAEMVALVREAASLAGESLKPGRGTGDSALLVEKFFAKHGREMAHGLGHGVGLDVHEYPFLRSRGPSWEMRPGMVMAVEPGLYDEAHGGCRLENDFLITETGCEMITRSRIVEL